MRPIRFPEQMIVYGEHQEEYIPLPAHKTEAGDVTSCWYLDWKERLKVLVTGKMYVTVLTFNYPLQPQLLKVTPPEES